MTANHETYLLMASTQNDMEDWVKTIRRVIWAPFGGGQDNTSPPLVLGWKTLVDENDIGTGRLMSIYSTLRDSSSRTARLTLNHWTSYRQARSSTPSN